MIAYTATRVRSRTKDAERIARKFLGDLHDKIQTYPPDLPTITGYRRTGTLGRSVKKEMKVRPALIVGQVGSDPAAFRQAYHQRRLKGGGLGKPYKVKRPYARYVIGPEQSRLMKSRGWKKAGDILKEAWPGQLRRFKRVIVKNA